MTQYLDVDTQAQFIPTIIAQKALGRFANYMNLAKTVARDSELTTQSVGDTISVPKRGTLVAQDKVKNVDASVQDPTADNVQVVLDTHKHVTFGIEDVAQVLQNQTAQDGYAEDAGIALAEAVEGALAGLYASLTATPITFDNTNDASIDASMRAVRKYFTTQKVPKLEQRHLYVNDIYDEILSVDKFAKYDSRGGGESQEITSGLLRPIYNLKTFESQSVVQTGADPILEHGLAYTRDAFVLATRPLPNVPAGHGAVSKVITDPDTNVTIRVTSWYDGRGKALVISLDLLFGTAVMDQRRAVEVQLSTPAVSS